MRGATILHVPVFGLFTRGRAAGAARNSPGGRDAVAGRKL